MCTQQRAMDLLMGELPDPPQGAIACRTAYRLARYSDSLFGSIQTQRASPEYHIARAIIKAKEEKVWPVCVSSQGFELYSAL